jgi:hypothetical protein
MEETLGETIQSCNKMCNRNEILLTHLAKNHMHAYNLGEVTTLEKK